jgi:crossover junction endodeoxyribonuclease RuvC
MTILGIDPGSRRIGYGLVRREGKRLTYLAAGILPIRSATDPDALMETKRGIAALVEAWRPECLSIERLYFTKNRTTGIQVAQARGVVLAACAEEGLAIREFTPNEIKLKLTGFGGADKKAVAKMVRLVLGEPSLALIDDAMDALGMAIVGADQLASEANTRVRPKA